MLCELFYGTEVIQACDQSEGNKPQRETVQLECTAAHTQVHLYILAPILLIDHSYEHMQTVLACTL